MLSLLSYGLVGSAFLSLEAAGAGAPPLSTVTVCEKPLDLLFIQDTTESFHVWIETIAKQISSVATQVLTKVPNAWFGVAEHKDKPFMKLGFPNYDWCWDLKSSMSADVKSLVQAYSRLVGSSGADLPEAHFTALFYSALDARVGWRTGNGAGVRPSHDGDATEKIVVLITDASAHLQGDPAKQGISLKKFVPSEFHFDPVNNFEALCNEFDYPDYADVKQLILRRNYQMIFVVAGNNKQANDQWQWIASDLNQGTKRYLHVESDFSDLGSSLLEALKFWVVENCHEETVPPTTAPPTTTAPETTAPPTTTTAPPTTAPPTTTTAATKAPNGSNDVLTHSPPAGGDGTTGGDGGEGGDCGGDGHCGCCHMCDDCCNCHHHCHCHHHCPCHSECGGGGEDSGSAGGDSRRGGANAFAAELSGDDYDIPHALARAPRIRIHKNVQEVQVRPAAQDHPALVDIYEKY